MLAPIALYPDNLVSMVLAASTYPAQVSAADQWLHMQGNAPQEQIAAGASAQATWDPSVKALTAFPQVLDQLAQNLQWTTDLGNAYYNQPQDVMQSVQVMRSRAQSAGNLQTSPQEVVTEDQGNIEIAPPTPEVVYVPAYNPWAVYGAPVSPYPGYSVLGAIGSFVGGFFNYGPGIALNAFATTPFGWLGWGLDWLGHAIFCGGDVWFTHSHEVRDWGFAHGGGRYWGARGEMAAFRSRGGFAGGRGGWQQHTFRSGLDRSSLGGRITPRAFGGGNQSFENRGGAYGRGGFQNGVGSVARGGTYGQGGRGAGYGYGATNGIGGQQAFNHGPQAIGRPQQFAGNPQVARGGTQGYGSSYGGQQYGGNRMPNFGGAQQYAGGRTPNFGGSQQFGRTPAFGGQQSYGSGAYGRTMPSYGGRSGYGSSAQQTYRSPGYGASSHPYGSGSYGGSNNYARSSAGSGGYFGGGSSRGYGGSYAAPRASSGGFGGHAFGGGGGYKAPSAPHFSSGGGGGHFSGGGGHSGGGHSSGGGGHSGGKHH
jgi:hypothetical protein